MRPELSLLPRMALFPALVSAALLLGAVQSVSAQQSTDAKPASKALTPEQKAAQEKSGGFRPERMKDPNLWPHAPKMTVTPPEEIPLKNLKLPPGFEIEIWAHGIPGGRMMSRPVDVMQMPDGSVLVSDEQMGAIYRVSYKAAKKSAPEKKK